MIKLDTFTIFLSWKCNFTCLHCGFSCGPCRNEKMSPEKAMEYITEASRDQNLKMVAYSGGEPFLFYDEVVELMSYSFRKKLKAGIVTNCFWADSYDTAYHRLYKLKKLGLEEIITSVDEYHLHYVRAENIRNVINAAIKLQIRAGVNLLMTRKSRITKENVHEILGIPKDDLEDGNKAWLRESSPVLSGRAKQHLPPEDLISYSEAELLNNPCYFAVRNAVVTPDGSMYACCGFGGATENGPSSITYGGNLNEMSFDEIYQKLKNNLLLNMIVYHGPYVLLKIAEQYDSSIKFRKKYVSNCDVCEEISSNIPLRDTLINALRELAIKAQNNART
ncbi:MAG TPA: hypothetical protein DCZ10_00730 [Pelotomaculum sp.]|nr:hypothetical protein [Pelotomaculum sp.]